MISSPYSTFSTLRDRGAPIGSTYEVIDPAHIAYWAPDELIPAATSTRRAMACRWAPPKPPAAPVPDLFAAMFGDSQA